jgi:hypothetical protein
MTPPYSEEDIAYMRSRPARFRKQLRGIDKATSGQSGSADVDDADDADDVAWVHSLTGDALREELDRRGLPTSGRKAELAERLLEAL